MRSVLVTGGSGTFGRAFCKYALAQGSPRVVALARHEKELSELENDLGHPNLRVYLGDVRDERRLEMAFRDIYAVVHAGALKRIERCEADPIEAVKTNVFGSMNVINAALFSGVNRAILLSTDKAADPVNVYGVSKLCAEKMWLSANFNYGGGRCLFSVARYGNIFASRGSVVPKWREQIAADTPVTITDPDATRFYMTINDAVHLVANLMHSMRGGELIVPSLRAYRLRDLATAVGATDFRVTGLPHWEKVNETLDGKIFSNEVPLMSVAELRHAIGKL